MYLGCSSLVSEKAAGQPKREVKDAIIQQRELGIEWFVELMGVKS